MNYYKLINNDGFNLNEDLLLLLTNSNNYNVRAITASRKILPEHILKILSEDEEFTIRCTIASRKNLPKEISEKLEPSTKYIVAITRLLNI